MAYEAIGLRKVVESKTFVIVRVCKEASSNGTVICCFKAPTVEVEHEF